MKTNAGDMRWVHNNNLLGYFSARVSSLSTRFPLFVQQQVALNNLQNTNLFASASK